MRSQIQLNLFLVRVWLSDGPELVKDLYSAEVTQLRRRKFKQMLKTSPNFGRRAITPKVRDTFLQTPAEAGGRVGRVTPCAPLVATMISGAHGVTRPTVEVLAAF